MILDRRSLAIGVALGLAVLAVWTTAVHVHRLLFELGPTGAIDLKLFHSQVQGWFAGQPIYKLMGYAMFPPASYAILWPALGWLTIEQARWLWAGLSVASVIWLVRLLGRELGVQRRGEWALLTVTLLAMNALGVSIGSGQLIVVLLPLLVAALLNISREAENRGQALAVALAFLVTLVKPTIAAPFFWIVMFRYRRWWPAVVVVAGYLALTVGAAVFQGENLFGLTDGWMERSSIGAATTGYLNIHIALGSVGLKSWMTPASLVMLAGLGLWVYQNRDADIWLLLGVCGVVARLWSYHRVYDDLLLVLPAVALARMAQAAATPAQVRRWAGWLAVGLVVSLCVPGRLRGLPSPAHEIGHVAHLLVWGASGLFLLRQSRPPTTPSPQTFTRSGGL